MITVKIYLIVESLLDAVMDRLLVYFAVCAKYAISWEVDAFHEALKKRDVKFVKEE